MIVSERERHVLQSCPIVIGNLLILVMSRFHCDVKLTHRDHWNQTSTQTLPPLPILQFLTTWRRTQRKENRLMRLRVGDELRSRERVKEIEVNVTGSFSSKSKEEKKGKVLSSWLLQ